MRKGVFFATYNQSDGRQNKYGASVSDRRRGDTLEGKNLPPLKEIGGIVLVADDTIFTTRNIVLTAEVGAHTRIHTTLVVVVFSSKFI